MPSLMPFDIYEKQVLDSIFTTLRFIQKKVMFIPTSMLPTQYSPPIMLWEKRFGQMT